MTPPLLAAGTVTRARIFIAEEGLLTEERRDRLEAMGHEVIAIVESGEAAAACAAPDLILMNEHTAEGGGGRQ